MVTGEAPIDFGGSGPYVRVTGEMLEDLFRE